MNNLIEYINNPSDKYRPLVRTAIMHAQFETIHPFMDGNVPLRYQQQIAA